MATFSNDKTVISKEFENLKTIFDKIKSINPSISILSGGMSGDYNIAIEQGCNMIRIGSTIFGNRQ
jgi:uncharacterized pyridoxal phosphate-containing UPF0001 family protein